jgi:hypothetical protein
VAGLVLASWSELLPGRTASAAVGFHYDAPSARAPQAILLCSVLDDPGYDLDVVRRIVEQTLDLARWRTVGPETLQDLGQFLPAAYLADDLAPGDAP